MPEPCLLLLLVTTLVLRKSHIQYLDPPTRLSFIRQYFFSFLVIVHNHEINKYYLFSNISKVVTAQQHFSSFSMPLNPIEGLLTHSWLSRSGMPGPESLFSSGLPGDVVADRAGPGTPLWVTLLWSHTLPLPLLLRLIAILWDGDRWWSNCDIKYMNWLGPSPCAEGQQTARL